MSKKIKNGFRTPFSNNFLIKSYNLLSDAYFTVIINSVFP